MESWENFLHKMNSLLGQSGQENGLSRLVVSIAIVLIGMIVLEIIFRFAHRRIQAALEKKGRSTDLWKIAAFLPPLRLAAMALLLRLIEPILGASQKFVYLLHGIEVLLLILAAIIVIYVFIDWLDRLRLVLPMNLQDQFPDHALVKLKSFMRVSTLVLAIVVFIYSMRNFFPAWFLQYPGWRYLLLGVVIAIVCMAIRQVSGFLTNMILVLKSSQENVRMRMVLEAAIWPIRLLLITLAIYVVGEFLSFPPTAERIANTIINVLGTLTVVIFVYRLIELMVFELSKFAEREDNLIDKTFVQMMRMIARIIVIVIGAIYLLRVISGKPLSALLAGLGIGGLALALAAQDTLKNFFGSIMIMLDKPFAVGQRVTTGGIDGTVEDIGFRSTRVRTLTGHLVTIPNEKLATDSVENIGRRPSIRRLANITITYDTPPEKVEKAVSIIREILDNHEGMDPDFPPWVFFNEFNDTSLNILLIYWYFPPDYKAYLNFTERVNLEIMRRFEAEGIEFAFPTTTTYLAQDNRRPLHISISDDTTLIEKNG
jgi:small-conductance mechanosensitive channel